MSNEVVRDTVLSVISDKIAHARNSRAADAPLPGAPRAGPRRSVPATKACGGATVPFIARYRKEVTGGLDDAQLRTLEERLRYLRELEERRGVLESIRGPGQARRRARSPRSWRPTPRPGSRTSTCPTSPSAGPRRRSPARPAWSRWPTRCSPTRRWTRRGRRGLRRRGKGVADAAAALEGARAILVERFAEDADLIGELRERMWSRPSPSKVREGKETEGAKFADYFDFAEPFTRLPSHRILAMFRGEKEEVLDLTVDPEAATTETPHDGPTEYERPSPAGSASPTRAARPTAGWPTRSAGPGGPRSWSTSASTCACGCAGGRGRGRPGLRRQPARPAARRAGRHPPDDGPRPGLPHRRQGRRGRRDRQGGRHRHIYPHEPAPLGRVARHARALAAAHNVELIAIGNGTASRETDKLAGDLIKRTPSSS